MIACVTFETSKVVEPALYYEINKAHIIHYVKDPESESGRIYDSFRRRVCERLSSESPREVEIEEHNERVSDFSVMLRTVLSIIQSENRGEEGCEIYVNISSGSPEYAAAATVASMMVPGTIPFSVGTKEYTVSNDRIRDVYFVDDQPVGMTKSTYPPRTMPIYAIDIPELVAYGKSRNVGLILWLPWLTVENNMDLFKRYAEWGIPGVKIDFMDRSDQWMVNFYERVIKEAAKYNMVVDFHGSFKPAGLERRYPNLLSYEGVRGMEQNEGCRPENTIWLPFIRNAVGAMDFTPGSMNSAQPEHNRCTDPNPMGMGTRACQMAMYVVFESGIQMLSDSPTRYYAEEECTRFISSVPVTWDETRVVDAKAGEYVVVARRKGSRWFIGAMGAGDARTLEVPLGFLGDGGSRRLTFFADGVNSGRQAFDYVKGERQVDKSTVLTLKLERNGGWCGVIE